MTVNQVSVTAIMRQMAQAGTDKSRVRPSSPRLHLQRGGATVGDTLRDAVNVDLCEVFFLSQFLHNEIGRSNMINTIKWVFER